ncbi:MAG: hypothetical protein GF346_11515 [Candidatus Eisenbacteria bacterium]|nr:hypothetical protein [Candidatus Latescibacterota bacterium]MBD3303064.1 hypothetical protein [Candidatus Eisenbacteria bacterium]
MTPNRTRSIRGPRAISQLLVHPLVYLLVAAMAGILLAALMTGNLSARYVKALIGGIFFLFLIRLPLFAVVGLFLVIFAFPTYIYLGNTNVIFVLFMLVAWGVRVRLEKEPIPPKTFLDYAAWCYLAVHVLSLVNVESSENAIKGIQQIQFLGAAVALYFLISKVVRTERHLRLILYALTASSVLVSITGVMEYIVPTFRLIPDWFIAAGPAGKRLAEGGRVGGVFGFHGLLADFCAILFILQLYLFIRLRNVVVRFALAVLMFAGGFQIFVTANRGGFVVWVIGLLYMAWIGRGALTLRRILVALPLILLIGFGLGLFVEEYNEAITLFLRISTTQFERGVPDTRVVVWREVMAEIPNHLWIGHGPYYDLRGGTDKIGGRAWPHSAYLFYLWSTGVIGLAVFLWILVKVFFKSYPGGKLRLGRVSFAQGAMAVAHIQILQFALAQIRDEHQRGNVYPYLMWALFGIAVAARRIHREANRAERDSGS